jgi:hypothetical protein
MYGILALFAITATAIAALSYIYLQIYQHPQARKAQKENTPYAGQAFAGRTQHLFLILSMIAILSLALNAYVALRPASVGPAAELSTLESKVDATRSKVDTTQLRVEATQSKVEATQSKVAETQSAISRIENIIAGAQSSTVSTLVGIRSYGTILLVSLVVGLVLLLVGFLVDYLRARPSREPQAAKTPSRWAALLQSAALFKIAGSFCLIGSVTVASIKFDNLIKIETAVTGTEAPAEMQVSLQYFVNQAVSAPPIDVGKPPIQFGTPPVDVGKPFPINERPIQPAPGPLSPTGPVQSTEVDCAPESDADKFVVKTFKLGKEDDLEAATDLPTRLTEILDTIEERGKTRELQGLVFIGSADKRVIGKALRERYSSNSTLAKKRAEFVRDQLLAQMESRQGTPRPRWLLLLNPDIPKVRLTIDDGKQFDALRAVQICVAWTKNKDREASRY